MRLNCKLITSIADGIKTCGILPNVLATGEITSIGKKGKDTRLPSNHRGITITSVLGKVIEHAEILDVEDKISRHQSYLQFGFSSGQSPLGASVIITEATAIAKKLKAPLYLATLDAQKAFDTVSHQILLHTLAGYGDLGSLQAVTNLAYSSLTSQVKWKGQCGESFPVEQGVRQGGILSTHLYKLYVNPLLQELTQYAAGFSAYGCFYGSPTCADDVVLLATDPVDLQTQLNIVGRFAAERRYCINASKSAILITGHQNDSTPRLDWTLNDKPVPIKEEATHLGISRTPSASSGKLVEERISTGRRTLYALMGSGIHGTNGIGISKCLQVYTTYVLPVVLHGLESLDLQNKDVQLLEKFHSQTIKHLQGLPTRTATCGAYLLAGTLPMYAFMDKARLSLLRCMILAAKNSPEIEVLLLRGTADDIPHSWTRAVTHTLSRYELPVLSELLTRNMSKEQWKRQVSNSASSYWYDKLTEECQAKKTLSRLQPPREGQKHHIWTIKNGCRAVRQATIKARMLCGVYLLQSHRKRFNQYEVDDCCMLCRQETEDLTHFLARCSHHRVTRNFFSPRIQECLEELGVARSTDLTADEFFTQAVLDFGRLDDPVGVQNEESVARYEEVSRQFCYAMHMSRKAGVDKLEPRRRGRASAQPAASGPLGGGS